MLIVQYRDITTKELFFEEKYTDFIPNINDKVTLNGDKIILGFVIDKLVNIYPNDNDTCINIYIKQSF